MRLLLITLSLMISLLSYGQDAGKWSTIWGTSPEYTGEGDMPKTSLAGKTLREIIKVTGKGDTIRLKLTNFHSDEPVDIKSVYISYIVDSCDIDVPAARYLTFGGDSSVTISPRENVVSDILPFHIYSYTQIAITISYGERVPQHATSHRGSRTTSFIANGRVRPEDAFHPVEKVDHWYNILSLDVEGDRNIVAVLGNSITDGRGSTTNKQNRWTDIMAQYLPEGSGVVNLGIGGNCVLEGGISQPLINRYRDELGFHSGIRYIIIYEGTNDIGTSQLPSGKLAGKLIAAYKEIIDYAHKKGIKVLMATITPTKGNGWYSVEHEKARQAVNKWIRKGKGFEGVIDFDELVRDPKDTEKLQAKYSDDWLHLNPSGYRAMGEYAAKIISSVK